VTISRAASIPGRPGAYALLQAAPQDLAPRKIGVIPIDSESGRAWLKLRREFHDIAGSIRKASPS